jgi:long-chain acyl-CoA synthetase
VISEILVIGKKDPAHGGENIFAITVPNYDAIKEDHPDKVSDDGLPNDAFIKELIKKEIEVRNRSMPVYKKINDFEVRKQPFEKNAQQKIKRFLYISGNK